MSKLAHGAPERDCTQRCSSRQHGDCLVAVASKRAIPDVELASYARWLCWNCGQALDHQGRTMLHLAASCGRGGVVQWLVKAKEANVNARDFESGYTPLHRSIFYGQIHVAATLMKLGASITTVDIEDLTPLEIAMKDRLPIVMYDLNGPCEVYMWGTNTNYTLGTGSQASRPQPELLDVFRKQNISIKQVVMHKFHSVFVTHDGRVFSCGHGQGGRLGLDSEKAFLMPCPVKLWNNPATGTTDVCLQAIAGRDHTILLMESGQVLTCGLNTHHQLGHSPPPAYLLTPRPLSQKVTKAAGEIRGVCAARFHSVIWSSTALLTCGLNAGQLGHLRTSQERSIIVPRLVSSLNHKDCHITHVAASDGATVVVMKRGDVYVLHEYQCRKIASRQLDIEKVVVDGGHLDSKLDSSVLMDRGGEQLRVLVLTKTGKLMLWQESCPQLTRCIFNLNRLLILKDVAINRQHLLFITADGEAFQGEVKAKKSRKLHQSPESLLKPSGNKWSAFNEFLDKDECDVVTVKKLPHIHRAVSITSDLKGRNFAVIQAHPKACLFEVPQVETSDMREHMLNLLQEAYVDDAIHDVEFQVGQGGRVFAAHKFLVASRSEPLAKLVVEATAGCTEGVPRVELASVHPQIFQQILQFIYTNACDLLRPGSCNIQIPKSNSPDCKSGSSNEPDVDANVLLDSTLYNSSAYEVFVTEGKNKKNKTKQHVMKKIGEDIEGNFCDPIRLAQEAAKKFGLSALRKKLDGVRYENGVIVSKNNRSCQPAEVTFDQNKHKELFDVTLRSEDGKELKAHKCILAARLDYFNSMFSGGWAEAQCSKALSIPVPYAILEVLVDFLYRNEATSVSNSEDLDFICNVLVLSDQLLIKRLKEICEVALANLITLKNVAHFLQFSETYNADQLKLCCMQYTCLNLSAILESRVLDVLSEPFLECLSKYYCELHPVMSRRIITPYANAPSDDLVHCVWESYPVSWEDEADFIEEKQKIVKGLKKKPRVRKTSSSDGFSKSGNVRLRNESVSSNEDVSQHNVSPVSFEELTEKECYTKMMRDGVSDSKDITLSLSKLNGNTQDSGYSENNQNMSWVKVLNHSSRQQKVVQARLKVISAIKESPEIIDGLPEKFINLTAAFKGQPMESVKMQPARENIPTMKSSCVGITVKEENIQSPVIVQINTENFPILQRFPPSPQDNIPTCRSPGVKSSELRKVVKLSQKQRKRLASEQSTSPPADSETQKTSFAWGSTPTTEVGSPTTSFTLLDVIRQEKQQSVQGSTPVPTPANRKHCSWAMPAGTSATSPTEQSSLASSNPWQKICTPPMACAAASPPAMSFTEIVADERKQRDNWTKMRAKPLQLTQLEDKAMEDLLVFYNAAGAMDERITVHRVSTGAIAMPVWITSHH